MQVFTIAEDLDLDWVSSAAAEAAEIDLNSSSNNKIPFLPNYDVVAVISVASLIGTPDTAPNVILQGREESTDSWTDLFTNTEFGTKFKQITLKRYLRVKTDEVTLSDGFAQVYLLGN
jgi:hypothetical protein